jgi:16S rRNA (guanine527-N7)-methyltransferase
MTSALARMAGRDVSRETERLIEIYVERLRAAANEQNLVSASTLGSLWERHILDSAQLVRFEPRPGVSWVDVGSGAGLPGIVIAALIEGPVTLVEPRRLRAQFLAETAAALGLGDRVAVAQAKVERVEGRFDVITGRAVTSLDRFLQLSHHLSTKNTVWVLPKGRGAQSELAQAQRSWHCDVRSEPSRTDPDSTILVLSGVKPKGRGIKQ